MTHRTLDKEDLVGLRMRWVTIDTPTPQQLAEFWEQLLGWRRDPRFDNEDEVGLLCTEDGGCESRIPGLLLFRSDDPKRVKNRVHIDLEHDGGDLAAREAEVDRALSLGARRVDIGQRGTEPWVVLADPEGNEFCIVSPPES